MAIRTTDIDEKIVATARFTKHAAGQRQRRVDRLRLRSPCSTFNQAGRRSEPGRRVRRRRHARHRLAQGVEPSDRP
jgi:hypothetical protein